MLCLAAHSVQVKSRTMGRGRRNRASLSDWYDRPDNDDEDPSDLLAEDSDSSKKCFSPTKRSATNFFMGDDSSRDCSREGSPKKRAAMTPRSSHGSDIGAIGDLGTPQDRSARCIDMGTPQDANVSAATVIILRGICADYFESNVAPVLRYVQQNQEQLMGKLTELTSKVEQKADAQDVSSRAEIEQVAAKVVSSREDGSKVAIHVRQGELEARVRAAEKKVSSLSQELRDLKKMEVATASADPGDLSKVKAVFAAAGLRVDKQLKDMRQQMQQLRDECVGREVGERWPGRKLDSASVASFHSRHSDNDSVDRLSLGASAVPSNGLEPEEKAELKKIQAIVAAAGKVFAHDLGEVKRQMREVRAELHGVKNSVSATAKSDKGFLYP